MKNLQNLRFEVRFGDGKPRIWIHADTGEKDFGRISFIIMLDEWERFSKETYFSAQDCSVTLQAQGSFCTFFRMEVPIRDRSGVMKVPFINVEFPMFARRIILRAAKQIILANEGNKDINIHPLRMARWEKLYNRGSGRLKTVFDAATWARIEDLQKTDNEFVERLQYLERIAKNSTRAFWEEGMMRIYKDGEGFVWSLWTPQKTQIMNGGLFPHSDGTWGVHT